MGDATGLDRVRFPSFFAFLNIAVQLDAYGITPFSFFADDHVYIDQLVVL
jgi:hypothetical protein